MIALGGLVANLADRFGRRIGKKKLMIAGLRPKHTAQLLTTLSGMMIAIILMVFYFAFSQEARDWAIEGQKVRQQRDQLLQEVRDLNQQRDTITRQKADLEKEKDRLNGDKKGLTDKIKDLNEQARKNSKSLKVSADRLAQLRTNQASLVNRRIQLEKAKRDIEVQLLKGNISLQVAQARLNDIKIQMDKTQALYKQRVDEINDIQVKNDGLERQNALLERQTKKAEDDKRQAEEAGQNRLAELDREIQARKNDLSRVQFQLNVLQGATNHFAEDPLVFARGDELARREIPAVLSPSQAEALYESTLIEASRVAEARGSRSKGNYPVVTLIPVKNPNSDRDITAAEQQAEVIRRLSNSESGQVLIIRAAYNAFQGDPVISLIEVSANPIVFRAGQVISDIRINGRLSEEEVFNQVSGFLRDDVGDKVRRAGMIPRGNQERSVGEVSALELVKLVQEIKLHNANMNVYALADDVTRASGPLKIRFRVR